MPSEREIDAAAEAMWRNTLTLEQKRMNVPWEDVAGYVHVAWSNHAIAALAAAEKVRNGQR